jgi:hypothetical protein
MPVEPPVTVAATTTCSVCERKPAASIGGLCEECAEIQQVQEWKDDERKEAAMYWMV